MILEGIHIPKAVGVHSDLGSHCDIVCGWVRSMRTWSDVISTGQCGLWHPRRGQWSRPRWGEEKLSK